MPKEDVKKWIKVASFTDAWIETTILLLHLYVTEVASFTDAWIETGRVWRNERKLQSHLLQMRGLKLIVYRIPSVQHRSHLLQMRGLKQKCAHVDTFIRSRIFYRCVDWNFCGWIGNTAYSRSHLLQMRGLKLSQENINKTPVVVASFTDAWIETSRVLRQANTVVGRIFYRCVDWNLHFLQNIFSVRMSHLLQMRGLKLLILQMKEGKLCRIFYRCVDWNSTARYCSSCRFGRIFYRCVDWNNNLLVRKTTELVASFTDAWIET